MATLTFVDAEDVVKAWLLDTTIAPLVTWGGKTHIYQGMPTGSPMPSVILTRVGGAPSRSSTVYEDNARISFSCWARNRPAAKEIARVLVSEIESISHSSAVVTAFGRLDAAETISWLWLPDPEADLPRYVVDALMVVRSA